MKVDEAQPATVDSRPMRPAGGVSFTLEAGLAPARTRDDEITAEDATTTTPAGG